MSEKERRIRAAIATINDINRTLKRKQIKNWPELDQLPRILRDDEVLENMVPGQYNDTKGLLVATNKRLIFVSKRWFSSNVEEFIFDKISAVETSAGKSDGELEIRNADGASAKFKPVPGDHLQPFAEYLKGRRPESPSQDTDQELRAEAPLDWVSRLDRLAALKSQGSISDEDFEAERTRILKGL